MSTGKSMYEKMMEQYNNTKIAPKKPQVTEADRMKKYFTTFLPDGVNSEVRRIRLLPPLEGSVTPFEVNKVHIVKNGQKSDKHVCPDHADGKDCPFCEARKELLSSEDPNDHAIAKQYNVRDMYVVRLIERGKEEDGVKFWRFNRDFTNNGVYDKIMSVVSILGMDEDITDIENGIDLIVTINRNQMNIPIVVSIQADRKNSPLTNDPELTAKILEDANTWRDVYKVKPYEFLRLLVEGKTPIWSSEAKGYVAKEDADAISEQPSVATDMVNKLVNESQTGVVNIEQIGGASIDLEDNPFA